MENKHGCIDNHNIRGKHKGEGLGSVRGLSGLESENNREKGRSNSGEIHGKIYKGPVTRSNKSHMMDPIGGNRGNGVEVNQQPDNSTGGLDDGHNTLEVSQNSLIIKITQQTTSTDTHPPHT